MLTNPTQRSLPLGIGDERYNKIEGDGVSAEAFLWVVPRSNDLSIRKNWNSSIMAVKLRRPILIGGIGLSFALWALESVQDSWSEVGEIGILGAIALGAGFWLFQRRDPPTIKPIAASAVNRETLDKAIAQAQTIITQVESEGDRPPIAQQLRDRLESLSGDTQRQELQVALLGGKGTGKTTLREWLDGNFKPPQSAGAIAFREIPALFTAAEVGDTPRNLSPTAWDAATAADLVLFLTSGDLTDPEFQTLQQLVNASVPVVVVWNKKDRYLPEQQAGILQQVRNRLELTLESEDAVAIAAAPAPVKVRQYQSDDSWQETMEQPAPDMGELTARLSAIASEKRQQLLLAQSYRTAIGIKAAAQQALNDIRRDRALGVLEKYQYISAAAAFANPVAALDLVATGAVTTQLVIDLGEIYQQKFSVEREKAIAAALGEQLVKLGLVELSTQTVTAVLKSNAVTYVAGGLVQGISAAYLTRLAGLSLIEYFQARDASVESGVNLEKLGQTLKAVFEQNQRLAFLQGFVKQMVKRLAPESKKSESLTAQVQALQDNRDGERLSIPNLEPST
jgi:hypothetical protein